MSNVSPFNQLCLNAREDVIEVWFAGVHSDVGGGFWFDGLSDIALEFMLNKARSVGLTVLDERDLDYSRLRENEDDEHRICVDDINVRPLPHGVLHKQSRSMGKDIVLESRLVRVNENDDESKSEIPIIHHTVCERFGKVTGYRPPAIRDRQFKVMNEHGKVIDNDYCGVAGLRKYCKANNIE